MRTRILSDERGVTLFETLVAAIMGGILLAIAVPSMSRALTAHYLQAGIRTTTNYVRVVRSTAVARNAETRLVVSAEGDVLSTQVNDGGTWTNVGSPVVLEGGVAVSGVNPSDGVGFNPQGTSKNGVTTLTLTGPGGDTFTVTVSLLGMVEAS